MKINWNDQLTLNLTDHGRDIYENYYRELDRAIGMPTRALTFEYRPETIKVELWKAAHIFGKSLYNGCAPAFNLTCELHRAV